MTKSNQSIIEKADMTLADLASGGLLNPEQAENFIRKILQAPTILPMVRVVRMNAPQRKIEKIGFGSRILHGATSATGLAEADRSKPTTETITLTTNEVIAEVRLPYDVIEDNIERGNINAGGPNTDPKPVQGGFKDTIVNMLAERVALDLEEMALLGDTALTGDDLLGLNDGYLKIAATDGHAADNLTAAISKATFKAGLKALPKQYHRNLSGLRHLVSVNQEIEYRDSLSNRDTGLGDSVIEGFRGVFGFGVPVEKTPMMPEAKGLLTDPKNLIMGIQRQVSMEVDKDISARVFKIVVTARVDFKIEEPDAVVTYLNIG
jgi:hypothetical protein